MCTSPLFTGSSVVHEKFEIKNRGDPLSSTSSKSCSIKTVPLKKLCPDAKVITFAIQSTRSTNNAHLERKATLVQRDNNSCSISHEDCFTSEKIIRPASILFNKMK